HPDTHPTCSTRTVSNGLSKCHKRLRPSPLEFGGAAVLDRTRRAHRPDRPPRGGAAPRPPHLARPHRCTTTTPPATTRPRGGPGGRRRWGTMDGAGPGRRGQLAGDIGSNLSAVTRDGRTEVFSYDIPRGDLRLAHYDRVRAPYWTFRSLHAPGLQPPNRYRAA